MVVGDASIQRVWKGNAKLCMLTSVHDRTRAAERRSTRILSGVRFVLAGLVMAAGSGVAAAQTYRDTRPIRGVWTRPPDFLTGANSFETQLQNFAAAGVTDVFIETFYQGSTISAPGVFRAKFSFDYLQAAIPLAARYGIRVHSWIHSAFWQFGTTGAYNFTVNPPGDSQGDPAWRVISSATGQSGGDNANWFFANLCHPGVQQKLRAYYTELAANYPGLWGLQTDYHRFPLDDNAGDSNPAPWSFDAYSRNSFMAIYGSANDPLTKAIATAGPSGTQYANFIAWRKAGVTEAARQMKLGIDSVDPGLEFTSAMFAVPATSKCQDWPTWASQGLIDWLVVMAYGSSTFSITNDLTITKNASAGRRVVAGLYTDSTVNHPAMQTQIDTCVAAGVQDMVFFSGPSFGVSANRTTLANFVTANSTKQRGDLNNDGYLDATDWTAFRAVYSGTPVAVNAGNTRLNYHGDSVIDEADWGAFKREFARNRFGEDGVVDQRSLSAFLACMNATQGGGGNIRKHLYDLDGNGTVTYADQVILHQLLTVTLPADTDVDRNGRTDVDDLYRQGKAATAIDVDRSGVVDAADLRALEAAIRAGEVAAMGAEPR